MPSITICRSQTISASPKKIFEFISDLSKLKEIELWKMIQPDAFIRVPQNPTEIGAWYEWEGQIVGQGNMSIQEIVENKKVKLSLDFLKPEKYLGNIVEWTLENHAAKKPSQTSCTVTRAMTIPFPWFMFPFLKSIEKTMNSSIGVDHELCLKRLAYLSNSKLEPIVDIALENNQILESFHYIGCEFPSISTTNKNEIHEETQLKLKKILNKYKITALYSFIKYHILKKTNKHNLLNNVIIGLVIKEKDIAKLHNQNINEGNNKIILETHPVKYGTKLIHTGWSNSLLYAHRIGFLNTLNTKDNNPNKMFLEFYKKMPNSKTNKPGITEIYIPTHSPK